MSEETVVTVKREIAGKLATMIHRENAAWSPLKVVVQTQMALAGEGLYAPHAERLSRGEAWETVFAAEEAETVDAPETAEGAETETRETTNAYDGPQAEWSPVPLAEIKQWLKENPDAAMESVFPTVYEEDRTAKIKDLATAQGLLYITHRRAAEQTVKELGFENYDYLDEQTQIRTESKMLSPAALGAADGIAASVVGLPRSPGSAGPEGVPITGATPKAGGYGDITAPPVTALPANGTTVPTVPAGRGSSQPDQEPRRADLSGDAQHEFRRQQRQSESLAEFFTELSGLLKEVRGESREGLTEGLAKIVEKISAPVINVPTPVVHVHVPEPADRVIEIARDAKGLLKTMKETRGKKP